MRPAIGQVCSLHSPFEKDIEDFAAGHCDAVDVWITKLEKYFERHSAADLSALLERHGVQLPVASFQGGLLTSQGDARREAWKLLDQRLQLCQQARIGTLVVAMDVLPPIVQQDIERAQVSLGELSQQAERYGVKVALEFQARSAFGNNLETASALVAEVANPFLGICLDTFHFQVGPSKSEDLGYLTAENLFHVQVCDLADTPREFATDADRILPGEGDIALRPLLDRLEAIRYEQFVSLELMNPQIWQIAPRQIGEIGMTAMRKLLGQAAME